MLTYTKLKRNPRKCVALTGLTPKEFNTLLLAFTRAYAEQYPAEKTMRGKPRKRQAGGGRKGVLEEAEQRLLFILVHQKAYPLQTLLGEHQDASVAANFLATISAPSDGENGESGFTYGVLVANELNRAAEIRASLRK